MDVNVQMHPAVVPEQHNAQLPDLLRLALTSRPTPRGPKFCTSTGGGKVSSRHTVCESVSVHDRFVAPEALLELSRRTLASL
jgi:hypothetical protein